MKKHLGVLALLSVVTVLSFYVVSLVAVALRGLLHTWFSDNETQDIRAVIGVVAVLAIIVANNISAAAIIAQTRHWSGLARALTAWDAVIAAAFAWSLLQYVIPGIAGTWRAVVWSLLIAGVAIWRTRAIMSRPGDTIIDKGEDRQEDHR